jgi:hypothetical protein
MKILVTGQAGSGKSSVAAELRRQGFAAYDTDAMEGVTGFDYADTGLPVGPGEIEHPIDFSRFSWNWRVDRLLELLESAGDVFICAITSNAVELAQLFDRVFVLVPDRETLAYRLRTRTNNTFGKHPAEAEGVLNHNDVIGDEWHVRGGITIDASRPLEEIVDDILARLD